MEATTAMASPKCIVPSNTTDTSRPSISTFSCFRSFWRINGIKSEILPILCMHSLPEGDKSTRASTQKYHCHLDMVNSVSIRMSFCISISIGPSHVSVYANMSMYKHSGQPDWNVVSTTLHQSVVSVMKLSVLMADGWSNFLLYLRMWYMTGNVESYFLCKIAYLQTHCQALIREPFYSMFRMNTFKIVGMLWWLHPFTIMWKIMGYRTLICYFWPFGHPQNFQKWLWIRFTGWSVITSVVQWWRQW